MTLSGFTSFNIGILVYFLGVYFNRRVDFLNRYNIPEPVSGGLMVAVATLFYFLITDTAVEFTLDARDFLLLYFFTAIGLNAKFSDLLKGGRPLLILLALTIVYMLVQNLIGVIVAAGFDLPRAFGLIGGTVSLIGGHGTAIAWAPTFEADHGVEGAAEIGAATATLGLIMASLIGGPIAAFLIGRKGATPSGDEPVHTIGLEYDNEDTAKINHISIMRSVLVLNIAIGLGAALNESLKQAGLELPLFVTCLICGILMSNTIPRIFPNMKWPARTQALAVISDLALGIFLSMSLMSLQLWMIAGLAGPMLVLLTVQVLVALAFIIFFLFRVMGANYESAVLSAGFGGFALGATPTAIANMTAVTKSHGPAPRAFLILPLISAFFVDLANAVIISAFL